MTDPDACSEPMQPKPIANLPASKWTIRFGLVMGLCASLMLADQACAQSQQQLYRGQTIIILVGVAPGGSFDLYAQLVARHLGNHIPGHPTIIVENKSGAGGMTALNYLYNVAPRDGTILDIVPPALALTEVLKPAEQSYDARKLNWIGRLTSINQIFYTWHTSPTKTLADLQRRETNDRQQTDAPPSLHPLGSSRGIRDRVLRVGDQSRDGIAELR